MFKLMLAITFVLFAWALAHGAEPHYGHHHHYGTHYGHHHHYGYGGYLAPYRYPYYGPYAYPYSRPYVVTPRYYSPWRTPYYSRPRFGIYLNF